jgi:hypothetical protein
VAGLVNGITYAANVHLDTPNPQAFELEALGGRYLLATPAVFQRLAQQGSGKGRRA